MTEEQIALARRAVGCKGWRWMAGMATDSKFARVVAADAEATALDWLSVALPRAVELARAGEREAERAAVVAALERWAEDGGDPWMSFCADRIKSGEHRRKEEE